MKRYITLARMLLGALVWVDAPPARAASAPLCEGLTGTPLPQATITFARIVDAGAFTPPQPGSSAPTFRDLPAFCRVAVELKPSTDSDIHVEVWLPIAGWNDKYLAVGSGGWGGSINYGGMGDALSRGYATSATDEGHVGGSGRFAMGHPEKFIDFAYRSEHEMTVKSKAIIDAFYGHSPRYSYWNGCSGGGREALIEAHRFPDDFDGIVAGDPANFERNTWALWVANAAFAHPAAYIPPSKYPMIHQAVLNSCDAMDGLKDGLIDDPTRCHFDPAVLKCQDGDGPSCLTAQQVETARTILSPVTSRSGAQIFPRLEPGTELRWDRLAGGPEPAPLFFDYFKYVVFQNPNWDWKSFDLEKDSKRAEAAAKGTIALVPDLTRFAWHGGKLLMYHGWADQQVAPEATVDFYKSAVSSPGAPAPASNWIRLFMAPGMAHCSGGEGPNAFDKFNVIEDWVERGHAPDQIVAARSIDSKIDRTRPLCPYPEVARYRGTGSIDAAANFACRLPELDVK